MRKVQIVKGYKSREAAQRQLDKVTADMQFSPLSLAMIVACDDGTFYPAIKMSSEDTRWIRYLVEKRFYVFN